MLLISSKRFCKEELYLDYCVLLLILLIEVTFYTTLLPWLHNVKMRQGYM